jgi:hypothetical protein
MTAARVSWRMPKKEKSLVSKGPQFNTFLALTGALVAELHWGMKKNRRTRKIADPLIGEAPDTKRQLSGKLKVERL